MILPIRLEGPHSVAPPPAPSANAPCMGPFATAETHIRPSLPSAPLPRPFPPSGLALYCISAINALLCITTRAMHSQKAG
jgi:hypothetical protein